MEINLKNVVNYLALKCEHIAETELTAEERNIGDNLWEIMNGYCHGHTEVFESLDFDQNGIFNQSK